VPFVTVFITILLLFILLIVLVALRFNGKFPNRSYRGIEYTAVAGIIGGVVCLFQSLTIIPYRYGFVLLLVSTLVFILWSHVIPAHARFDKNLPPLGMRQHLIAGIAGLAVVVLLAGSIINANAPQPPYGVRQRLWDSYDAERQAAIAEAATGAFRGVEVPFLIIFSLFPASIMYFVVREITADREPVPQGISAAESIKTAHS
jgi:hypothetical protein